MTPEEVTELLRSKGMCGYVTEASDTQDSEDPALPRACILECGHDDGYHESVDDLTTGELLAIVRAACTSSYHPLSRNSVEAKAFRALETRVALLDGAAIAGEQFARWQRKLGEACSQEDWRPVAEVIGALGDAIRGRARGSLASVSKIQVDETSGVPL